MRWGCGLIFLTAWLVFWCLCGSCGETQFLYLCTTIAEYSWLIPLRAEVETLHFCGARTLALMVSLNSNYASDWCLNALQREVM